jgi:uncharacterized iron-regulated protein
MSANHLPLGLLLATLVSLTACSGTVVVDAFPDPPPALPASGRSLVMLDGHDGSAVSWDVLVQRAAQANVVLVGETHGHPEGLAAAAFLFEDLLARDPNGPALALEFFERDEQLVLDELHSGVIDEAEMITALDLSRGSYPPGHRAMLRAALDHGRPVWAANAPRRYVRLARTESYEHLAAFGPRQRALYELPDALTPGDYRERFAEAIGGGHSELDPDFLEGMYRSQNLWDATMADTVREAHADGARPVVLVVGRFHVEFDGGLAQRLEARAPWLRRFSLSVLDVDAEDLREQDRGRADVVIYAGASD